MRPHLTHLALIIAGNCTGQSMFGDEFSGITLDPRWIVVNPNPDSQVGLTGNGEILMHASPLNGGSDYAGFANYNAPFILQPVCGDWTVAVKLRLHPTGDAQDVGIILFPDSFDTHTGQRVMERRFDINCGFSNNWTFLDTVVCLAPEDTITYMRLTNTGGQLTGAMSKDSVTWVSHSANWGASSYRYAGLLSIRQPWNGDNSLYTNAYFDYFRFLDLDSLHILASPSSVVGVGNSVQLSVDAVANGAYTWYDPNGNQVGDSSTLIIDPANTSNAGWYHVIVSRLDCEFLTDSLFLDVVTGMDESHVKEATLIISPNPAKDRIIVDWSGQPFGPTVFHVVDAMGRTLLHQNTDGSHRIEFDVPTFAPGAYFVKLQGEQWEAHGKFIKQ